MSVLEKSLEDMKEVNGEEFRVVRSDDDEMIVRCDDQGTIFTFIQHINTSHIRTHTGNDFYFNNDDPRLIMTSPVSGAYSYEWDKSHNAWRNVNDGHFMYELFTREIMGLAKGFPNL